MSCLREKRGKFELAQIELKVHPRDKIRRPPNNWTLGAQGNDDQEGRSELIPRDG